MKDNDIRKLYLADGRKGRVLREALAEEGDAFFVYEGGMPWLVEKLLYQPELFEKVVSVDITRLRHLIGDKS